MITDIPAYWKRFEVVLHPDSENFYIVFHYGNSPDHFVLRMDDIAILNDQILSTNENGKDELAVISSFSLEQNYPNPFNPGTDISFRIPNRVHVTIRIFNVLGQQIRILLNQEKEPGKYIIHWDGKDQYGNQVPSGVYFYSMEAGTFKQIRKMILIR
jgi:hypothetical protein